jgi:hypothetical protein
MFDRGEVHVVVTLSIITVYGFTEERFMLLLLFYHYCLSFDRGVVHVVVVMFSTITVYGLTEEWFMFFWLVIVSTITV